MFNLANSFEQFGAHDDRAKEQLRAHIVTNTHEQSKYALGTAESFGTSELAPQ